MAGTDILDAVLSSGQNEGVERSVLPLPQMASIVNARQRKTGRWGKRFGVTQLSTVDSGNSPVDDGIGNTRCVGPGFCVTDDMAFTYDNVGAVFVRPSSLFANAGMGSLIPWVPGAVSAWQPLSSAFPIPATATRTQNITPCSQAMFAGYLWSAGMYQVPAHPSDYVIRVAATNPADNTLCYSYDVYPTGATAGDGGVYYPKLVVCGGTLVLVYAARLSNAARGVRARNLTTLTGGFGAEVVLDTNVDAGGTFDVCSQGATVFALVAANATTNVSARRIAAATLASVNNVAYTSPRNVVGCSVTTSPTAPIFLLLSTQSATPSTIDLEVYNNGLTALVSGVGNQIDSIAASIVPPVAYCAILNNGNVRIVYDDKALGASTLDKMTWVDYTPTGALAGGRYYQFRVSPISRPFNFVANGVDQFYCWTANTDLSGYGFATLIRLSSFLDFANSYGSNNGIISAPVEMSLQDFVTNTSVLFTGQGLSQPVQVSAGVWASLLPVYPSIPDAGTNVAILSLRCVMATHHTGPAAYRSINAVAADGAQFVAGGAVARVGSQFATSVGFTLSPKLFSPTAAAGGALQASSTYEYVAVFTATTDSGRGEVSGVSQVMTVALGIGQTQVTFFVSMLGLGARPGALIEIYRTLSNGSTFYRLGDLDAIQVGFAAGGFGAWVDQASDTSISANKVLYVQVGQTLPNAPPPPCRFAMLGGQRLWLGGLFRSDVAQCSKLILGDQSPTFCDSDSFRVVAPSAITGLAFMDNLMLFTDEGNGGVYVVTGDGPDDSGSGEFSPPTRLPYAIGCIEPRSLISVDEGTFFQSRRGLYMIPRGFGAPVPAGDVVMDTLATFPIITGVSVVTKATEQTIHWTCVDAATPTAGAVLIYDLAHKCWSVDRINDGLNAFNPQVATGQWYGGEAAYLPVSTETSAAGVRVTTSSFSDLVGASIQMVLQTGDLRPFGVMSEGVISKIDTLAEVRSACTLNILKTTEWGTSPTAPRVFALAAGDYQIGSISYTETELGNAELRDAASLRITWSESSTSEGLAFAALAVEHEQGEGLKRVTPLSRAT